MRWYLSLYTDDGNSCRLLNYYEYPTKVEAQYAKSRTLPEYGSDFYRVEYVLGELDTTASKVFVGRDKFANSRIRATMQQQAGVKAMELLELIPQIGQAKDKQLFAEVIATEIIMLEPTLTKEQYDVLLTELEKQPYIRKLVTERGN